MRDDRRARPASAGPRPGRARAGRARSLQRPVPVLLLGLERAADDAGGGVVDEHVERAERGHLLEHPARGDVAADEHRLGAGGPQLVGGLLGGACRCAGSRSRRACAPSRAKRSAIARPMPARAAGDEDVHAPPRQRAIGGRGARDLVPAGPARGLARALLGLRGGVAEPVEQLDLLLGVAADVVVLRAGRRRARGRAPAAGRRTAASPARRARRRRRGSARASSRRSLTARARPRHG